MFCDLLALFNVSTVVNKYLMKNRHNIDNMDNINNVDNVENQSSALKTNLANMYIGRGERILLFNIVKNINKGKSKSASVILTSEETGILKSTIWFNIIQMEKEKKLVLTMNKSKVLSKRRRNEIAQKAAEAFLKDLKHVNDRPTINHVVRNLTPSSNGSSSPDITDLECINNTPGHEEPCRGRKFCHFGLKSGLMHILNKNDLNCSKIFLNFNVDGLPISKNSTKQFWPILCSIVDLPDSPFLVSLYEGFGKPHNINDLLEPFVIELLEIMQSKIEINGISYEVEINSFNVTHPQRQQWQRQVVITLIMAAVKTNLELRTNDNFRRCFPKQHKEQRSILEQLPIDMVQTFPIEISSLKQEVSELKELVEQLKSSSDDVANLLAAINQREGVESNNDLKDIFDTLLPISTIDDLKSLDELLKVEENATYFTKTIRKIGGKDFKHMLTNVIKELFRLEVQKKINWSGQNSKHALKDTVTAVTIINVATTSYSCTKTEVLHHFKYLFQHTYDRVKSQATTTHTHRAPRSVLDTKDIRTRTAVVPARGSNFSKKDYLIKKCRYTLEQKVQILIWHFAGNSEREIQRLFAGMFEARPNRETIRRTVNNCLFEHLI
ncbi:unnamed protein product [Brassicogethes aeneus]|uniref:DUF4806 domain-containing protein n=1 Tax=Brassicogethes aeneus TaxID=1431903 RepID=A0A9P0B250_BRAAE|nr:unnamed protein product [Brassicogethes aeneus]